MKVHTNIESLPAFSNAVVTIGTFDGVHTGHQQIISQLKAEAVKVNGETVIITFDPHPRKILANASKEIRLINTIEEKIELLSRQGIDHLVIIPFTEAFSLITATEYITDFLVGRFRPHTIIIGYDHRFGQGRKGDYHLLEDFSGQCNYHLIEIPVHILQETSVSSTRIREAISIGNMETANQLLGYPFFFEGRVVEGNKLGRTIGYPTANLRLENPEKLLPGNGVYAVTLEIGNKLTTPKDISFPAFPVLKGMMNIGFRPTVGGHSKTIEVHIFDFGEDIYDKSIRVTVRKFMRGERKFEGLDALKTQLEKDKSQASEYLSRLVR